MNNIEYLTAVEPVKGWDVQCSVVSEQTVLVVEVLIAANIFFYIMRVHVHQEKMQYGSPIPGNPMWQLRGLKEHPSHDWLSDRCRSLVETMQVIW